MLYKTIIQGSLHFANQKSFDKVLKMYVYRAENYYKSDIIFDSEEVFHLDTLSLNIPRYVNQHVDKTWKNTVTLLEYCSQFAVSGDIRAWETEEGVILNYARIEPQSDKGVVIQFHKGKKLSKEEGKEEEALKALTKAIEKYDAHAEAYERRGRVNYMLKKYHDAERDYNKSLKINPQLPHAYYGRSRIYILQKEYEKAIADLDLTLKYSIALQSIYWEARRTKAECHINLEQYEKAAFDLKLFTNRTFKKTDINYKWKRLAYFNYGLVLIELEKYEEALKAFEFALAIEKGADSISEGDKIYYRGFAKYKAGKSGYIKDIKKAADEGNEKAKALLTELT